jgi:hypothetical protein
LRALHICPAPAGPSPPFCFTEQALKFHHTADTIAVAARRRDREGVLEALGTTLQRCTACHAAFRQRVVDQATWTALTGAAAPMHPPGH